MRELSIKKLYYSISEVSKITEVEQYVLRYWESEFEELQPQKNRAGNRAYTNRDIQLILLIKTLLRERKYTIEGAKKLIAEQGIEVLARQNDELNSNSKKIKIEEKTVVPQKAHGMPPEKVFGNQGTQAVLIDKKELMEFRNLLESLLKLL
ncbi:MAG: MerR family transcriptional regulator [Ignavibacteria bacterium]|nr:MerR family transcriptional regulator [Ignavibacteria bacterium]